jgi:hypothetical protein
MKNNQTAKQRTADGDSPVSAPVKNCIEKKGYKRAEAAVYLGVSKITIDRLTKRGLLHPSRALRHSIYSKDDLDRFLRETTDEIDHQLAA